VPVILVDSYTFPGHSRLKPKKSIST